MGEQTKPILKQTKAQMSDTTQQESTSNGFFKPVNSFRLTPAEQQQFNALFETLHPADKKPDSIKELVITMLRSYVHKPPAPEPQQLSPAPEVESLFTPETLTALQTFLREMNDATRSLFQNEAFAGFTAEELLQLMLDYCKADPCEQFPREEILIPLYNKITNDKKEATTNGNTAS